MKLTLTSLLSLLVAICFGQITPTLSNAYLYGDGYTNSDASYDMCLDNDGNVIMVGNYQFFTATINGQVENFQSTANSDCFAMKVNPQTGEVIWFRSWGGPGNENANAVALHPSGKIMIAGNISTYEGLPDMDPTAGENFQGVAGEAVNALFVLTMTPDGEYVDSRVMGGTGNVYTRNMIVQDNGDVVICGAYTGEVAFDNVSGATTFAYGDQDAFVVKYNQDLNFINTYFLFSQFMDVAIDIVADASNNVYVAGYTEGNSQVFYGAENPVSNINTEYLIKLTPSFTPQNARFVPYNATEYGAGVAVALTQDNQLIWGVSRNSYAGGSGDRNTIHYCDMNTLQTNSTHVAQSSSGLLKLQDIIVTPDNKLLVYSEFQGVLSVNIDEVAATGVSTPGQSGLIYEVLPQVLSNNSHPAGFIGELEAESFGVMYATAMAMNQEGILYLTGFFNSNGLDVDMTNGVSNIASLGNYTNFLAVYGGCQEPVISAASLNQNVCVGQEATFSTANGESVDWLDGATQSYLSTGPSVTVTIFGNGAALIADNGCANNTFFNVNVVNPSNFTATINGPTSLCEGSDAVFTVEYNSLIYPNVQWYDGTIGATLNTTISQDMGVSATLYVNEGCFTTAAMFVDVIETPDYTASLSGNTITCSAPTGNSNFFGVHDCETDQLLNTSFENFFILNETGSYYISVTNPNEACVSNTECVDFIFINLEEAQTEVISIYPNPASDVIKIDGITQGKVVIIDMTGREVLSTMVNGNATIDISSLPAASYIVRAIANNTTFTQHLTVK
jgi:hypothetical protein